MSKENIVNGIKKTSKEVVDLITREEEIREAAQDYNDERFNSFIDSNVDDLRKEFTEENQDVWMEFCKNRFNEGDK